MVDTRRVSVGVDADVSPFVRNITKAGLAAKGFARDLESADTRMANLVQSGLALAPALVPLGAAAIPAIAGLTTQLGFAVAGAGTAVLAFQGVGDALDALNKYQIDPTSANFEKLREELDTLGPAGQEFVLFLQELRPEMQRLQDIAQQGMLPGVEDGIRDLMQVMPQFEGVITRISSTLGNLTAEAGDNLNDPRWVEFFEYLDREAGPTLTAMGRSFGLVVEGLANMVMAFNPLADSFTTGMLRMSQAFADWSAGLSADAGFQSFLDYVRDSGPLAMEALGSIASAMIGLVEAAAPVGKVVLPMIEALADGISAIASSPAGPILITLAAAVGTLGRSMAILQAVGLRGGDSMLGRMFGGAVKPMRDATTALGAVATASERATMSVKQHEEAERKRSATMRAGLAQIGKAGAVVGGLALAQSGLAESSGLANTATYGLLGTIAGPWGAAVGGGIGLAMDFAGANNDLEDSLQAAGAAARTSAIDFTSQRTTMQAAKADADALADSVRRGRDLSGWTAPGGFFDFSALGDGIANIRDLFGDTVDEGEEAARRYQMAFLSMRQGAADFYAALNDGDLSMLHATDEELTKFVTQIAPAVQAAGLNIRDVLTSRTGWDEAVNAVRDYNASMDSASGKSRTVGAALAELAGQMESNVTQAEKLKNAMDALFGVELSQAEGIDAWIAGLKDLRTQIEDTNGSIKGNSVAALENREAIRDSVEDLQARVSADAAAGVSGAKLAQTLLEGRDAIVAQAVAAGAKKKDIEAYLDTLGMTPKNLETIITTPGLMTAKQQIQALGKLYGLTPKEVRTLIKQAGMDTSQAEIKRLAELYDITPKQVRTLLQAVDQASNVIAGIGARLNELDGRTARVYVATYYSSRGQQAPGLQEKDGGVVDYYANGGIREKHIAQIAPAGAMRLWAEPETGGEAYIPLSPAKRDRSLDIWRETGNRLGAKFMEFATGGILGGVDNRLDLLNLEQQIRQLQRDLAKTGKEALGGLNRAIAQTQLEIARRDIRQARNEPMREFRTGMRDARSGFDVDGDMTTAEVRAELREFRAAIREAGGEWTKRLQGMGDRLIRNAQALNKAERAVERETQKRERLTDKYDDQIAAMEQLQSVMDGFASNVARSFLSDPFNGAYTIREDAGTGRAVAGPDPALIAARDQLQAAESRLAGIRSRTDIDPLERSYLASKAVAEVAQLRSQVEQLDRGTSALGDAADPAERTVSSLEALRETLERETEAAAKFGAALDTLIGKGLDTTGRFGGLFAGLAQSGDLATAEGLAALTPAQIDEYEKLFTTRDETVAEVASRATQAIYSEQQAILQKNLDVLAREMRENQRAIDRAARQADRHGDRMEAIERRQTEVITEQMQAVRQAISSIPRETEDIKRGGRGRR